MAEETQTTEEKEFEELRAKAEELYHSIKSVYCPYLKDDVHFSREGFEHLLFKSWNRTRSRKDQQARLRLIPIARKIIAKSHTLQEYAKQQYFIRQKVNSRWEKHMKNVKYYVFVAILNKIRLKIVIKEVEGSSKKFHSLYPSWKVDKKTGKKPSSPETWKKINSSELSAP